MRRLSHICNRFSVGILVLLGVLAVGLVLLVGSASEPRYGGERLSVWLRDWYRPPTSGSNPMAFQEYARKRKKAEAAVHGLGTNAVPSLRRMLRKRDSALKTRALQYGWVRWLATKPVFADVLDPDPAWRSNRTAAQTLSLLGSSAKEAVPDLIQALETNPDEECRRCAAVCLRLIGPDAAEAVPALTRASILGSGFVRMDAREALRSMGNARTNGLAVALEYEHSRDSTIQTAAWVTLDVVDPGRVYGKGHSAKPSTSLKGGPATTLENSEGSGVGRHR